MKMYNRHTQSFSNQKLPGIKIICYIYLIGQLLILIITGCSHTNPYYRSDQLPQPEISISDKEINYRIILIGDAGAPRDDEPVLSQLNKWAMQIPMKSMVIFMGDNIYPRGMPDKNQPWRDEAERHLRIQIEAVKETGSKIIFVPGNHDWQEGLKGILRQQEFIQNELLQDSVFLPANGCPGPEKIDLPGIRLIIFDTDYWIRKMQPPSTCKNKSLESTLTEIKHHIETAKNKAVVIITHHPLNTHGPHGGFFDWRDHIFPLSRLSKYLWIPTPLIGSLYPLVRWHVVKNAEDINSSEYEKMIADLRFIFEANKPFIYAAGHEHSLQVLVGKEVADYLLVSGAGTEEKISALNHGKNSLFAYASAGFMTVDFLKDGRILLQVIEAENPDPVFRKILAE